MNTATHLPQVCRYLGFQLSTDIAARQVCRNISTSNPAPAVSIAAGHKRLGILRHVKSV